MEQTPERFQELLVRSRQAFLEELLPKVLQVNTWVKAPNDDLSQDTIREIFRFFHSLRGSAATLELERLAALGKAGELLTQDLLGGINQCPQYLREILKVLGLIEQNLNFKRLASNNVMLGRRGKEYTSLPETGKILLIDDDTTMLNLLESAFTSEGYTVYICDDSLTAMDIIAVCKPDVILLDIMMPKVNGYEILGKIKEQPQYSDICVIFLSAMDDLEAKIKGMSAGVDDYITKPFSLAEVVSRVEMILRRANKYKEKLLYDDLTGAYSRSCLNERFKDELDRYKRNRTLFSVAFIDLDFFKHINDEYGHPAGDFVLKTFVDFMKLNLRECDCLFRYGGEEFVILLPDTDEAEAFSALDRLREIFARQPLSFAGNSFTVTFSCGIKEVDEKDKTVSQLLSMVDEAMYAAKKAGRNRVIQYSSFDSELENKKTVLLVDDENTILKLLSERLSEVGYHVIVASKGIQALDLLSQQSIDAVVLDLLLPDMNGLEICRKIKKNALIRNTRVVILSQKSREEDIVAGLQSGADDYVTKPFSLAELEARIMRVLKR